jgi:hypothetical protein
MLFRSILTSAEVNRHRERMLDGHPAWSLNETERLIYTVISREGTLRRLYQAVIATPVEGTELTAAMRETEQALGLSVGQRG